jgi:protein-tyrosine-phosphatase
MAAALLEHHAGVAGWDAAVSSAGTRADGMPIMPDASRALVRRGFPTPDHVGRLLTAAIVDESELILVMERTHLLAVAALSMAAVQRAFCWAELAGMGHSKSRRPGEDFGAWVEQLHSARAPATVLDTDTGWDVPDPTGHGRRAHRRTAERLDGDARRIVELASGTSG